MYVLGFFTAEGSDSGTKSPYEAHSKCVTIMAREGGAAWKPDTSALRKANKITLSVFKKSWNFSAWFIIFLWEAELFRKETVILSSIGQPTAVLWNPLGKTAPFWLYREIWLLRVPSIISQLNVCNGACKNACDVGIFVSDKAGMSTDLTSLPASVHQWIEIHHSPAHCYK